MSKYNFQSTLQKIKCVLKKIAVQLFTSSYYCLTYYSTCTYRELNTNLHIWNDPSFKVIMNVIILMKALKNVDH